MKMKSTSFTQGKVSSISIGGSISSEGFLSSILLSVVIIVTVVFVVVVLVVVVIAIVGVVIVVVFGIILCIDELIAFRAEEMPSLISCRMAAKVMAGVSDVDWNPKDPSDMFGDELDFLMICLRSENSDNNVVGEEDEEHIRFLGGNSFSRTKKYQGSNSSDGDNIGRIESKAGGVIGSGDEIGSIRIHIEQRIAAMMGYRGGSGG
ncbi:hypothetical protein Tco_0309271 [Tanacetum coccineum]